MTTIRQMQSLLSDGQHAKLLGELSQYRGDLPGELVAELGGSATVAVAMSAIRLQELNQSRTTLYRAILARLVSSQESNGSWGDVLATTLAVRALLGDEAGKSAAVRGIQLIVGLQKDDGSMPRDAMRRLPGDAMATAFVLAHLSRSNEFAHRFRVEAAIRSLTQARPLVSPAVQSLIKLAVQRASASVGGQAQRLVALAMAS